MIDYIQKGGLLMWPILACSIVAIAVFAERFFYLHRATIHVGEFLKGLSNLIQRLLSKDPAGRPASAAAVVAELDAVARAPTAPPVVVVSLPAIVTGPDGPNPWSDIETVADVLCERLGAERAVLPGAGHAVQNAPGFNDVLVEFVQRSERAHQPGRPRMERLRRTLQQLRLASISVCCLNARSSRLG